MKNNKLAQVIALLAIIVSAGVIGFFISDNYNKQTLAKLPEPAPAITTPTSTAPLVEGESSPTVPPADKFDFSSVYEDNGFIKDVVASDLIKLPSYDLLVVKKNGDYSFEEEVESEVGRILSYYGESKQIKDKKTQLGDWLEIAYVGTIDGESFDGGTSEANNVQAGGTGFIGTFQEQLIGKEIGVPFTIEVEFPSDYWEADLAGKKATFETTVNYIHELVPFDDAFVAKYLTEAYSWTTASEAKIGLADLLKDSQERNAVYDYIDLVTASNKEVIVPQKMIQYIKEQTESYIKENAASTGTTVSESVKTVTGFDTVEALHESYVDSYRSEIMFMLVIQAIAEKENIVITKDVIETSLKAGGQSAEDIAFNLEYYGLPYMAQSTLANNCMEFLRTKLTYED